jgi:hypothetical protein
MFNIEKSKALLDIFKDKRVAIVGPSPHLIGSGLGSFIDEYDIVCRVNDVHPTGYESDYGNTTDVVFHNCGTRFIDDFGKRLVQKAYISKNLKCVICPCVKGLGSDRWQQWDDDYVSPVVENFKSVNIFNTPFHWIGVKDYKKVYREFGSEPNAGQTAIIMILEHEVKELLISGFSFYAQGNHPSVSHRPGHTNKELENGLVGEAGHPQGPQVQCFVHKVFKNYKDKIKVDFYLNNLLGLSHDNVLEGDF